ncbi:MAG: YdbL family protein [Pseudomonadota bacterium]
MTNLIRIFFAAFAITALGFSMLPDANAGGPMIEKAQRDGLVGERIDGYLGIVDQSADAAIKRRVNEINALRRAEYDKLAQSRGVASEAVARITGEKQIDRAPSGSFVMRENGAWTRK